jgi:hypothetical protein
MKLGFSIYLIKEPTLFNSDSQVITKECCYSYTVTPTFLHPMWQHQHLHHIYFFLFKKGDGRRKKKKHKRGSETTHRPETTQPAVVGESGNHASSRKPSILWEERPEPQVSCHNPVAPNPSRSLRPSRASLPPSLLFSSPSLTDSLAGNPPTRADPPLSVTLSSRSGRPELPRNFLPSCRPSNESGTLFSGRPECRQSQQAGDPFLLSPLLLLLLLLLLFFFRFFLPR